MEEPGTVLAPVQGQALRLAAALRGTGAARGALLVVSGRGTSVAPYRARSAPRRGRRTGNMQRIETMPRALDASNRRA